MLFSIFPTLPALNSKYSRITEDDGCNRRPHQASIQVVACATREPHFEPRKPEHDSYPYVSLRIFHSAPHTASPRIHFSPFSSMSLFISYSYCFMHDSFSFWLLVRRCGGFNSFCLYFESIFFASPQLFGTQNTEVRHLNTYYYYFVYLLTSLLASYQNSNRKVTVLVQPVQ